MSPASRWRNMVDREKASGFFEAYHAFKTSANPDEWTEWGAFLLHDTWDLKMRHIDFTFKTNKIDWISFVQDYTDHVQQSPDSARLQHYSATTLYHQLVQSALKYDPQFFVRFSHDSLPHCWDVLGCAGTVVRQVIAFFGQEALDLAMVVFDHVSADEFLVYLCQQYDAKQLVIDHWALEGLVHRVDLSAAVCARLEQTVLFSKSPEIQAAVEKHNVRHQRDRLNAVVDSAMCAPRKKI